MTRRTAKWRMNDQDARRAFGARGFRSRYVTMELAAWRRAALPVVRGRSGSSAKDDRKRNDRRRDLRQEKHGRCRPDKLPRMTHRLAERTFGRVIVGRKMVARWKALVRFRLGRSRARVGINSRGKRGRGRNVDVSLGDKALKQEGRRDKQQKDVPPRRQLE